MEKILIGGNALAILGSSRATLDVDYLINISDRRVFIHDTENEDWINAGGSGYYAKFFLSIFNKELGNKIASPQSLLDLKTYAYFQHIKNENGQKADDAEFDIKFLVRKCNLKSVNLVVPYLSKIEQMQIKNLIKSVRK